MIFLGARGEADAFGDFVLGRFAADVAARGRRCVVDCVLPGHTADLWDAVVEVPAESGEVADWLEAPALRERAARVAVYAVSESIGKDDGLARGRPTPGVKVIVPWVGRDDVARSEQRRHWDEHVPLANRIHVGVRRYERNWVDALVLAPTPEPPAYQGVACQQFDSFDDLEKRSFDRPESVRVIQDDVADFIARFWVLLATEHVLDAKGAR